MAYPKCAQGAGRGVVVDNGRLLLVRGNGDGTFWSLPGGRADLGEDIKTCVAREVFEETGLRVSVGSLYTVRDYFDKSVDFHVLDMMFFCSIESGSITGEWIDPDGPIEEARFFTLDEIRALPFLSPEFLKLGEWLTPQDNDIYRGFEQKAMRQNAETA